MCTGCLYSLYMNPVCFHATCTRTAQREWDNNRLKWPWARHWTRNCSVGMAHNVYYCLCFVICGVEESIFFFSTDLFICLPSFLSDSLTVTVHIYWLCGMYLKAQRPLQLRLFVIILALQTFGAFHLHLLKCKKRLLALHTWSTQLQGNIGCWCVTLLCT